MLWSAESPVGIDIETIHEMKDLMDIAKRFYSCEEYERLAQCEGDSRLEIFFDIWTKKESFIKAIGQGLSLSLKSFTVPVASKGPVSYQGKDWYIHAPEFQDKKYKVTVCTIEEAGFIQMCYLDSIGS